MMVLESLVITFLFGSFILNVSVIMLADMLERRVPNRDPLSKILSYIYVLFGMALVTYSIITLILLLILSPMSSYPNNLIYEPSSFVDKSMDPVEYRLLM